LKPDGLFELKRKWLPLFVFGSAMFGAGIALTLLWLYRQSPFTDAVVDFLTPTSPEAPPRGTLISLTAALFTVIGGGLLLFAIRRINASEVGEIDSFWWKVAVAALAGQWWLGEPRVAVLAAGPGAPTLLRALKTFSGRTVVLARPTPDLALALAEDEAAMQKMLAALPGALAELSDGLRLRGRFLPPGSSPLTLDAVTRAEALIVAPALDDESFGLNVDDKIAEAARKMRGRRILVGAASAAKPDQLRQAVNWAASRFGSFHVILANNNSVKPLPPGRFYQKVEGAVERDLVDWESPERWEAGKLAVFLREAITRR
jgi:hypothetical protein